MEGVTGKPLAAVLSAGRADFNQRFKLAQQHYRGLTADDWLAYIKETLGPVADAVAAHDAERVAAVVDVLYDQGLPLVAQHWLGPQTRQPVLATAYRQLLCALAPALAGDPQRLSGSLLNALHQICLHGARSAQQWADSLARIAAKISSIDSVLALGVLLAWRGGMAAYREAALQAGATLQPQLAQAALGLPQPPAADLWVRLMQAPTLTPEEITVSPAPGVEWLGWIGGYTGLGGPYAKLPRIGIAGSKLAASDGTDTWWLAADGYGIQSLRMGRSEDWPLQSLPVRASVAGDGTVTRSGQAAQKFAELETAESCTWYEGVLAVTLRTSYQVALLRCPLS